MSNEGYARFREGILVADYDLLVASVKASLVRGYTYNDAHDTVADVVAAGGVLNGTTAALTTPSVTNGVFNADPASLTAAASASNHGILVYQASAVTGGADVPQAQQLLVCYLDVGTGLPIQPGTNIVNIVWSVGANKIFAVTS